MAKFDKATIIGVIVILVLLVGGAAVAFMTNQGTAIDQYDADDQTRPQLSIGQTSFEFGKMSLSDTKIQEIPIQNTGNKSLVLSDFVTSCDCTFAQVVINDQTSPRFSMRRNPSWRGEIFPGASAVIKIIYEPKIMPVKGKVKREIVFRTNDPNQPLVNMKFTALVE